MKFQQLHVLSLFIIFSCTSPVPQEGLPVVLINGDEDHVAMGLSELVDDFEIIPLETNENALIGRIPTCLIHANYVIVVERGAGIRLLQFDRTGKFIREMGNPGKGPGENGGDLLGSGFTNDGRSAIFNFSMAQGFNVYDLEGGSFKYSIPSPDPFILAPLNQISDSLFFIAGKMTGVPENKIDSALITFINTEGKITHSIPRKSYPSEGSDVQNFGRTTPYRYENKWRIYFEGGDTIFQIEQDKLVPRAILTAGEKTLDSNQKITHSNATDKIKLSLIDETSGSWLMSMYKVHGIRESNFMGQTSVLLDRGPVENIIIDKETLQAHVIRLKDDIFSILTEDTLNYMNIRWQDDGVFYFIIPAVDVLALMKKANHANFTPKAANEMEKLKTLHADDNPVVFVFHVKEHLYRHSP